METPATEVEEPVQTVAEEVEANDVPETGATPAVEEAVEEPGEPGASVDDVTTEGSATEESSEVIEAAEPSAETPAIEAPPAGEQPADETQTDEAVTGEQEDGAVTAEELEPAAEETISPDAPATTDAAEVPTEEPAPVE
jgi:hypothetical protein